VSRVARKFNTFAVVGSPVLLWLPFAIGFERLTQGFAGFLLLGFAAACLVLGVAVVPAVQLLYWWRQRRPACLVCNDSEVIDVARELGYRPFGQGKHLRVARWPLNEIFQVEFAERHLRVPGLPEAWEGLTILHVSDLHFRGIPDKIFYQHVMDRCARWRPEVLALTGDVVDSAKHYRWIMPVLGRLQWQTAAFAILGNHDQWYDPSFIRRRLKRLGMNVLGNGWQKATVRDRPLIVIGHEGPWFTPEPDLSDCPQGFRLCLSHTPDNIAWARQNGINLMLSGHNHGGQIRFPLVGSVYVPSIYGRRYDCGTFDESPTILHVSRGLAGQHPVRYLCKPEVALLVLHRG
jgi:predicted MPP superfamily phosphohydrolase